MQLTSLHKHFDKLQTIHGDKSLKSIYGAGCIKKPEIMFVFMNPTGRNVSAQKSWCGLRAPWLGTKNVWGMFSELGLISKSNCEKILELIPSKWIENFAENLYQELKNNKVYVTNLAKCTQIDARALKDKTFIEYRDLMLQEISFIKPKYIVTFGNQVSSILLEKNIKVSDYKDENFETLKIQNETYKIYPTFYPVGQGRRNMPYAIKRIKKILKSKIKV